MLVEISISEVAPRLNDLEAIRYVNYAESQLRQTHYVVR